MVVVQPLRRITIALFALLISLLHCQELCIARRGLFPMKWEACVLQAVAERVLQVDATIVQATLTTMVGCLSVQPVLRMSEQIAIKRDAQPIVLWVCKS